MAAKQPSHPLSFERHAGLEAGTNAHYEDTRYYFTTYADRQADVDYYVEQASGLASNVLEYGVGNGRIALPLARAGMLVCGVDRSAAMLRDLKEKAAAARPEVAARITVRRGDMRNLRLQRRFPLVLCTFNTFLHLYTRRDVERFCARVHAHLQKGGRFIVDVSVPDPEELSRDPSRVHRAPRFRDATTREWIHYTERFDYDQSSQVLTIAMGFKPKDAPERAWMTPLSHRQFFPQELEALLHYNGLPVIDVHADFDRDTDVNNARTLIYHCRRSSRVF